MVLEVEVGIKNRSKIDLNLGKHLDVEFSSIFFDFGGQNGAKLGGEIDKKSIKNGHEKRARAMPRNKGPRRRAGRAQGRQGRPGEFSNPPEPPGGPLPPPQPRALKPQRFASRRKYQVQNQVPRTRQVPWVPTRRRAADLRGLQPMPPPSDFSKILQKSDFSKNWSKSIF